MILTKKSDTFGALASSICLIHCLITPLVFVAQTSLTVSCAHAPGWWRAIDLIFLVISFFAVYSSATLPTKNWIKIGLWVSWVALLTLVVNENFHLIELPHECIYVPSLGLIVLHLYNKKYHSCCSNSACANPKLTQS